MSAAEVYPAASLQQWRLPSTRYKRKANLAGLADLVDQLKKAADWLDLDAREALCRASDHAIDAIVAALTARAAAQGLVTVPAADQLDTARSEGWIAIPTSPISSLNR
jgi:hypothetical protein